MYAGSRSIVSAGAAALAVLANERGVDHHSRDLTRCPALDERPIRLDGGNGGPGASGGAHDRGDRCILGQRRFGIEPALVGGEGAQARGIGALCACSRLVIYRERLEVPTAQKGSPRD
jgi:hypothetical protein